MINGGVTYKIFFSGNINLTLLQDMEKLVKFKNSDLNEELILMRYSVRL
jgi:hypothetical protein